MPPFCKKHNCRWTETRHGYYACRYCNRDTREARRAETARRRQPPIGGTLTGTYETGKTCDICGGPMPDEAKRNEHFRCGRELAQQIREDEG